MSVEFEQEKEFDKTYEINRGSSSGLTNWIVKTGIAKDEKNARIVMAIIAIICFILAIYFLTY